ncbi:hypothetical protein A2823_00425 [Candidatus Nomurabacteria bacterium RIFCSPHIGHO2_01_FULL_41_91]|uniref:Uncharacterized protein n=1 Tax=Candidatus Nomurabacteria bacterium RIFCSPLOWO2_12_FULL_41_10 TaxID=1801795 RepID=A0A1F6YAD7_9BACT|nr:MAG: hypothetical protein A2823_00425 [Candidatus Nomurabacteria bacterium RIFCSPHIGHO2_01_FULL_41_91]OGI80714.1 MAG: hypothetical protein A3D43_02460 [Candidatus Nomurabacteria bacterium RIFCSPHIGHO2_02_FULL_41_52]OGI84616.1 MAG: hypothetical protein A3F49_02135 [Candidatus Nomurabacteria bacterium RIFCSPHIGHO2_12_FULL_42_19]OGI93995.1 MAG: hypothetical protein A3A07_00705 [Candidatus Nomurabacteria bacterium RIFCSPLOWO2_01_FULL_41_52]OGI97812.1 MAG: hypothetical protein A3H56_00495 [Candid
MNKWALWKIKTKAEDNIIPSKTIFARLGVLKIIEEKSIKTKAERINQKDPISNMVPNKDTCDVPEKRAESRNTKVMPNPDTNNQDLGKTIRPSENRAIAQKTTETASPKTKSRPFEVSTGILVKGKQKIGNNTTTKNSDKNESLSNIFECISFFKKTNKNNDYV